MNLSIIGELAFGVLDEFPFILTVTNRHVLTDPSTSIETVRLRRSGEKTDARVLAFAIDQFFGVFNSHVEIRGSEKQFRIRR